MVLKPRFGSWGRDVVLCSTADELDRALAQLATRPWFAEHGVLAQELVPPLGWDLRARSSPAAASSAPRGARPQPGSGGRTSRSAAPARRHRRRRSRSGSPSRPRRPSTATSSGSTCCPRGRLRRRRGERRRRLPASLRARPGNVVPQRRARAAAGRADPPRRARTAPTPRAPAARAPSRPAAARRPRRRRRRSRACGSVPTTPSHIDEPAPEAEPPLLRDRSREDERCGPRPRNRSHESCRTPPTNTSKSSGMYAGRSIRERSDTSIECRLGCAGTLLARGLWSVSPSWRRRVSPQPRTAASRRRRALAERASHQRRLLAHPRLHGRDLPARRRPAVAFIVKYRSRGRDRTVEGSQVHGHTRIELIWTAIPIVIITSIFGFVFYKLPGISSAPEANAADRLHDQDRRAPVLLAVHVPERRRLDRRAAPAGRARRRAVDQCGGRHPQLVDPAARRQDRRDPRPHEPHVVPARQAIGTFYGQCAEFCGLYHERMLARVVVTSEADYRRS